MTADELVTAVHGPSGARRTQLLTPFDEVVHRIPGGVNRSGMARCPAHDDSNPSLSVGKGDDGRVLLRCFAGCSTEDVVSAIGLSMADLFERRDSIGPPGRLPGASHVYRDVNGDPYLRVRRLSRVPGAGKEFRLDRWDGEEWVPGLAGRTPILYRLPELIDAVAAGETVWVVEGEKDAETLARLGVAATTNPMGAGKWHKVSASLDRLAGADVSVICDTDFPGYRHALDVANSLEGLAAQVRVYEPAKGKDVTDHVSTHGLTLDDLVPVRLDELEQRVRGTETAAHDDPHETGRPGYFKSIDDLLNQPPLVFRVDSWIPDRGLALLYGPPGSWKTFLAIDIALAVATGTPFLGRHDTIQGGVVYVAAEGSAGIGARLAAWLDHHDIEIPDRFHAVTEPVNLSVTQTFDDFVELLEAGPHPDLVVFDTLHRCTAGADEDRAKDMGVVLDNIGRLQARIGCTVLLVHHPGKDPKHGARGSSSLLGAVDAELALIKGQLKNTKQKDAPAAPTTSVGLQTFGNSAVIVPSDEVVLAAEGRSEADVVLQALIDHDPGTGLPSGEWEKASGLDRSSFQRIRKELLDADRVSVEKRGRERIYRANNMSQSHDREEGEG